MGRLFKWASPDPTPGAFVESGGGGGGGGGLTVGDPDISGRPFNAMWTPGDGVNPTWVMANLRVTAASGQSAIAWLEIWLPDLSASDLGGSVALDRTAEAGGVGNAVVEGCAYALVPPTHQARLKWDAVGGSAVAVGVHERILGA